ncbi:MAG: GH92 family glycosyl hydrolase [Pyrinomonadaceae bacterium]
MRNRSVVNANGSILPISASLRLCGLILLTAYCSLLTAQTRDYTRWVNPFIGTGGHGHTFPGATLPFGMVQLSPDTRTDNWDGSSGYHYSDDVIYGFSHTHLSGTGIPDGCDILFMPTLDSDINARQGNIETNGFASKFSHSDEKAEPGYYSVRLEDGISTELTSTTRVGLHKYTFRTTGRSYVLLDLKWRDRVLDSKIENRGNNRIEGYRTSSSWAKNQTVYFVAEFSKPFAEDRIFIGDDFKTLASFRGYRSQSIRAQYVFNTKPNDEVLLKVAISSVSIEGARKNLEAELPGWDFDKVRADAKAAWNKELSKIEVSGGTDDQTTTFYTALYHTMIQPNVFNDVDGRYRGLDGKTHNLGSGGVEEKRSGGANPKSKIQNPKSGDQYTVFSLWDTFRAAHPLYTIIDQRRTVDFINTFIRQYEQGGRLPVWELWGEETDTMIGYHAVSVIADAMAKGIKGFDYEKAYRAAKHSAELDHFGLAAYKKRGYISMEDENESVSKTLEYAYNDWCLSQIVTYVRLEKADKYYKPFDKNTKVDKLAERKFRLKDEGLRDDYEAFLKRARYFENLFDPRVGFFVPKKNGGFVRPFAPNEVTFSFTEGNSWQYSFFVPHDVTRLMELMGGREKFAAKLDELFTTDQKLAGREQPDITGLIGQYAHGNEPSHHIAYLYNYAGEPWKTQKYVRQILDEFYKPTPDGLIGNEDCGQMSAWYILSASGFYPVAPGDGVYAFGTPLFPEMTYRLENGKTFSIRAKNVSDRNFYISSATLNRTPLRRASITHADVMNGGILEFTMTDATAATAFAELPKVGSSTDSVAVPRIELGPGHIFIRTATNDSRVYFTVDGSEPTKASELYVVPFKIGIRADQSFRIVKAVAVDTKGNRSKVAEFRVNRRPNDWTVRVISPYSTQYTGGGDNAIIDGIRGTVNFASGEWQGYQGKTFEAVIDLQRKTEIKEVGGGFLQSARSWIWMPERIEFEASNDGANFVKIADFKPAFSQTEMNTVTKDFIQSVTLVKARFVRVRAHNFGKIPTWHPGAGGDPWIFVDEIFIR